MFNFIVRRRGSCIGALVKFIDYVTETSAVIFHDASHEDIEEKSCPFSFVFFRCIEKQEHHQSYLLPTVFIRRAQPVTAWIMRLAFDVGINLYDSYI